MQEHWTVNTYPYEHSWKTVHYVYVTSSGKTNSFGTNSVILYQLLTHFCDIFLGSCCVCRSSSSLKPESIELWYLVYSIPNDPLPSLFKKWPCPGAYQFYIDLYKNNFIYIDLYRKTSSAEFVQIMTLGQKWPCPGAYQFWLDLTWSWVYFSTAAVCPSSWGRQQAASTSNTWSPGGSVLWIYATNAASIHVSLHTIFFFFYIDLFKKNFIYIDLYRKTLKNLLLWNLKV